MQQLKNIKDMTPNQALIDGLKRMLELAEKGELRSMFFARGYDDQGVDNGWYCDDRSHGKLLLAEMAIAQHDFITNIQLSNENSVLSKAIDGD